jgi:hypothetical protein
LLRDMMLPDEPPRVSITDIRLDVQQSYKPPRHQGERSKIGWTTQDKYSFQDKEMSTHLLTQCHPLIICFQVQEVVSKPLGFITKPETVLTIQMVRRPCPLQQANDSGHTMTGTHPAEASVSTQVISTDKSNLLSLSFSSYLQHTLHPPQPVHNTRLRSFTSPLFRILRWLTLFRST